MAETWEAHRAKIKVIHDVLAGEGHDVRVVGGAVRDLLSGRDPKDVDLATTCPPDRVMTLFSNEYAGYTAVGTGLRHGTVTVVVRGTPYEVTTLRRDVETDGRHAEVEFTEDWEADAARRDLTINAMSMDLGGKVYDYFNGQADLRSGTIRFVGNPVDRIREDYLRIMRYFRFASTSGKFPVVPPVIAQAIASNADGLAGISGERIWKELTGVLSGTWRAPILAHMQLLRVPDQFGLDVTPEAIWTIENYDERRPTGRQPSMLQALSVLLQDRGTRSASPSRLARLHSRLKFDNGTLRTLEYVLENVEAKGIDETWARAEVARGANQDHVRQLALRLGLWDLADVVAAMPPIPKFPVSGNDVKDAGIVHGPSIGKALAQMRERWVATGYGMGKAELLAWYISAITGL